MELFLNFVWLSVSLALILNWIRAVRRGDTKLTWGAVIALSLLLILLLPVISMTDDLGAIERPSEVEHVVRRSEMPLLQLTQDTAALLDSILLTTLLFIGFAILFARLSRFTLRFSPRVRMDGFLRVAGVRPPPTAALAV